MKIVIDIPGKMVKDIKNSYSIHYGEADTQKILRAIKKSDVLPEYYNMHANSTSHSKIGH